jgi:DNA-binding transcriptional LysR family regulator
MDLAQLRAFVTVAEELHFGRAALRLGISQPQVSRHIRALEAELDVELFVRTARRTALTDAGALLLPDARDTLASADRVRERATVARRTLRGRVGVAFLWSTLGGYLSPLVAAAADRHPEIELAVSQIAFRELLPAVRRGDVDVAIARPLWREHELVERIVRRERSVVAVAHDHPLAARPDVAPAELDGLPMIVFHRSLVPEAYDGMIARARERGIEVNIVQHARSASEALALASAGIGAFRLPASAAAPFPGVVYLDLRDSPSRVTILHRPLPPPPVQAIIEIAASQFGDVPDASKDSPSELELSVAAF